jgi:transcription antitermination factor NusA-like protein
VKLPICVIDAQTNTLCRKCKQLYREGKISDTDIEISKIIIDVSKSNKDLKGISFYSSYELSDVVMIITRKQDVAILSSPEIMDKIKQNTQKEVRFLEKTNDPKKLVESLLDPVPIVNVSTLYLPPFSDKEYKIEIERKFKNKLPIPEEIIVQTVTSVLDTEAYIEYV